MNRSQPSLITQLFDLILIQLSNFRWSWRGMLTSGIAAPLLSLLALGTFARDSGPDVLAYVLTGNVVLALMFENLGKVSNNFAFMKAMGTLDYFATLPIHRYMVILASLISFLILSLPALLVMLLVGSWFLRIHLVIHLLWPMVVVLTAVSLAALGALIGVTAPTPQAAGPTTLLLIMGFTALGPVIIPPERLPQFMRWIGWFSPATYAASAMRQTLLGPVMPRLALDLLVLAGLTLITGWAASRKMDWRQV
ncbi:MAG: ABC transporter permease [Ardenticatenaceae bacterium]|nr:ABC transporter permease [Ardenticatenaceae bacterium]MCB9443531.1 ABC transporter permease [Ardenticatenaceae bacterium]